MIAEIAGEDSLPAEIVAEIVERTDGVPLFVEELTKAVLETGARSAARCCRGCGGNRGGVISEWINDSQPALARRGRLRHAEE
jgi:hypothetical protein